MKPAQTLKTIKYVTAKTARSEHRATWQDTWLK